MNEEAGIGGLGDWGIGGLEDLVIGGFEGDRWARLHADDPIGHNGRFVRRAATARRVLARSRLFRPDVTREDPARPVNAVAHRIGHI
jgi:hypothetical protein